MHGGANLPLFSLAGMRIFDCQGPAGDTEAAPASVGGVAGETDARTLSTKKLFRALPVQTKKIAAS